jgi:hypothetical protein
MSSVVQTLAAGSICWIVTSSLWIYPHSLSYFNESVGGPFNGTAHLLGSNVDWGQDLRYTVAWLKTQPKCQITWFAYYGSYNPGDIGLTEAHLFHAESSSDRLDPGLYVVSVNWLRGYPAFSAAVNSDVVRGTLLHNSPVCRVTYTVCAYRIR